MEKLSIIVNYTEGAKFGCKFNCHYCIWKDNTLSNTFIAPNEDTLIWAISQTTGDNINITGGGDPLFNLEKNIGHLLLIATVAKRFGKTISITTREYKTALKLKNFNIPNLSYIKLSIDKYTPSLLSLIKGICSFVPVKLSVFYENLKQVENILFNLAEFCLSTDISTDFSEGKNTFNPKLIDLMRESHYTCSLTSKINIDKCFLLQESIVSGDTSDESRQITYAIYPEKLKINPASLLVIKRRELDDIRQKLSKASQEILDSITGDLVVPSYSPAIVFGISDTYKDHTRELRLEYYKLSLNFELAKRDLYWKARQCYYEAFKDYKKALGDCHTQNRLFAYKKLGYKFGILDSFDLLREYCLKNLKLQEKQ